MWPEHLVAAQAVYFSGITLSLYSNAGLGRFLATLELAGERGAWRVFDGNFRPRGWGGDLARAAWCSRGAEARLHGPAHFRG